MVASMVLVDSPLQELLASSKHRLAGSRDWRRGQTHFPRMDEWTNGRSDSSSMAQSRQASASEGSGILAVSSDVLVSLV